jgi:chondroitin-sulfate-ABC endolyase/exolyase
MKQLLYILLSFVGLQSVFAQSYTFEASDVPTAWVATNGTLALSTERYKDGASSLLWESEGVSELTVLFTAFTAGTGNSAFLQIYSPEITNDTLVVEFLLDASVKRKAVFLCNYKGWHEFNRAYNEFASTTVTSITNVRITLKPTSSETRRLYFDSVNFNRTTEADRIMGSQWVLDKNYLKGDTDLLVFYSNPIDIPLETPTASETIALTSLRNTLKRSLTPGSASALTAAKDYVNSLNIVRNADGSVRGNPINTSATALTETFMTDLVTKLEVLAAAGLNDAPTLTLFQNFVDHLLDQGISEGLSFRVFSNSYNACRIIPGGFLDILPACTAEQKVEILKLVRWMSFYGSMYFSESTYLANNESDVIYLFLPHIMAIALNQPDNAVAVRELKAFKRFLERNTEYTPGGKDIFKPDGTGFHHGTHYNNYMYSYKTWVQHIYYLKGTPFRISADAYQRFKKAIISVYTMGTQDTGDTRYFANAISGRKPFDTLVQFSKAYFDYLVAIGTDILGAQDNEVASAYNYFFKATKYNAPATPYEGFYQFNYSPLGIYRKGNWVASMRSPTKNFFGTEIYDDTNRFGRYQANGSLEIMYSGSLASSGYPASSTSSGGWDWNVVPGATTVHYTSWQEMMPYKSPNGRFDQKTKTKNFAGALSFGDCGMYAADFDQLDTWSSSAFTATNLVYKKSMFAFENMIISLGSSIGSSGTYSTSMITATNLFQSIVNSGSLNVNGTSQTSPYSATISTTDDNWMVTPLGTGYFIPKGNDALHVKFDTQSTPNYTGADYAAPTTTVTAAKAYLNHGVKPSSKSYSFVVVPATNATSMQSLATEMANGGGSIYQIQAQNSAVHALTYKPLNITAYSFFGAASNLSFGIVKANTAENLLMDKHDVETNRHYFAICNPNLKPINNATYKWIASDSQTTLTLDGEWLPINQVSGVAFSEPLAGQTQVTVNFSEGEPVYFGIKLITDTTALESVKANDWMYFSKYEKELQLKFRSVESDSLRIKIHNTNGQVIYNQKFKNISSFVNLETSSLQRGLLICTVTDGKNTKSFKWIN